MTNSSSGHPLARRRSRTRTRLGPWLVLPALILLLVFVYRPLFRSLQLSFFGSDLFGNPTRFVGLRNYISLLLSPDFQHSVLVSLGIALLSMAMSVVAALTATVLLRRWLPGAGMWCIIFSLPFAFSAAAASAVFAGLFAPSIGVLNEILANLGLSGPPWLEKPGWALVSISITTAWYEFGFAFLVLSAAIQAIPPEILEAAELDGTRGMRFVTSMLVPLMSPSLFFLMVTQTITGIQAFTQIQILTGGGPAGRTNTLVFQLYQFAFGQGTPDYGRASVVAIILVLLVAAITWLQFALISKRVTA